MNSEVDEDGEMVETGAKVREQRSFQKWEGSMWRTE